MKKVTESGLSYEDFTEGIHRKLAQLLFDGVGKNALLSHFSQEELGTVSAILLEDKNTENKRKEAENPLKILLTAKDKAKQQALLKNQDDAETLRALDQMLKDNRRM